MVDCSISQIKAMSNKTDYVEAALGRAASLAKEAEDIRSAMLARLDALERPRVDRVGGLETTLRDIARQVKQRQQNWITNWGAHEQSLQILREELLGQLDQLRRAGACDAGARGAGTAPGATFVRMDEEERRALRRALDKHGRELARLESGKADAILVGGLLNDKAPRDNLDAKLDRAEFEARLVDQAGLKLGAVELCVEVITRGLVVEESADEDGVGFAALQAGELPPVLVQGAAERAALLLVHADEGGAGRGAGASGAGVAGAGSAQLVELAEELLAKNLEGLLVGSPVRYPVLLPLLNLTGDVAQRGLEASYAVHARPLQRIQACEHSGTNVLCFLCQASSAA